jgi:hypothetical protein
MEQRNKWALSCCLPRQCVSFPCGLSPQGVQVRILHIFFLSRMDVICPTYFILTLSCVTFLNMLVLKGILCALTHYKDGGRPHTGPPWLLIAMFTASAYIWSLSTPSITWGHAMPCHAMVTRDLLNLTEDSYATQNELCIFAARYSSCQLQEWNIVWV